MALLPALHPVLQVCSDPLNRPDPLNCPPYDVAVTGEGVKQLHGVQERPGLPGYLRGYTRPPETSQGGKMYPGKVLNGAAVIPGL